MSMLILMPCRDTFSFELELKSLKPDLEIQVWPNIKNYESVQFAVCWNHPNEELSKYPNLKVVSSYGAGVDQIINDKGLDKDVKICRVLDPTLSLEMSEFIASLVLQKHRSLIEYLRFQQENKWIQVHKKLTKETVVGFLGLGQLGIHAATYIEKLGFKVKGWSKSKKSLGKIETFSEDQLEEFLSNLDYLVCLLPLTKETKGFLNKSLFNKIKNNFFLINVARGEHIVEQDLLDSISNGQIIGAALDVFEDEPLRKKHPFWQHPKIQITPHIASLSNSKVVAQQVIDNYERSKLNKKLSNEVSRAKGY